MAGMTQAYLQVRLIVLVPKPLQQEPQREEGPISEQLEPC